MCAVTRTTEETPVKVSTRWTVVVHLEPGEKVRPQFGWPEGMVVGDKVNFYSPDGKVRVKFKAIDPPKVFPFGAKKIVGAIKFHTVLNPSKKFVAYCEIKPRGKFRFIGWEKKSAAEEYNSKSGKQKANPKAERTDAGAGMTGGTGG